MSAAQTLSTTDWKLEWCAQSDIGRVRKTNEDVFGELPDRPFFMLADGMGGHQAGEVAAQIAVRTLSESMARVFEDPPRTLQEWGGKLHDAILEMNHTVYTLSLQDDTLSGMGTTLVCALFTEHHLIVCHVGDSRLYRLRNKELVQLTRDHTLREELRSYCEQFDEVLPSKGVLTRAIGTHPLVEPDIMKDVVIPGDRFLLCSDGLSDCLSQEEISMHLLSGDPLPEIAADLIAAANEKGGPDNTTVLLIHVAHLPR